MSGIFLEDLDMTSHPMIFDLASYFGFKTRQDRLDNKQALVEIYNWALSQAKTPTTKDLLSVIRKRERNLGSNFQEDRLSSLRRGVLVDTIGEVKEPKEIKPKAEKKEVDYKELFKQGLETYVES